MAWTRIIPSGLAGSPVNAAGVKFYKDLITELLKNGIVPAITMFHWWAEKAVSWGAAPCVLCALCSFDELHPIPSPSPHF